MTEVEISARAIRGGIAMLEGGGCQVRSSITDQPCIADTAENVKFGTEGGDVPNLMAATYGAKTATPDLPIEVSDEEGGSYFVPAPLSEAEINRNMKAADLNSGGSNDVHD